MTEVALTILHQGGPNPPDFSTEQKEQEQEQVLYPGLAPVVLGWFKQTTRPRNWCLQIAFCPWLDYVSILVVLLNCISLGMYQPGFERRYNIMILDAFVLVFFFIEMLINSLAKGGYGYKWSYLSDNWNKFDIFINFGELFNYLMDMVGFDVQICRVLGPMRLLSRVAIMRDVMTVLLDIFPVLTSVRLLFMFVVHIFAIMAVQLWAGQLRNRCFLGEDIPSAFNVSLDPYYTTKSDEHHPFICSPDNMNGERRCSDVPPYRENGIACSLAPPRNAAGALGPTVAGAGANTCVNWNMLYNVCRAGDQNPNLGAINFDNIGYAWIAIFQVITMEGWANIMFHVMDAYSFWSFLFFILVTVMGSFIMMNVCGVVIATQFSDHLGQMMKAQHERRASEVLVIRGFFSKLTPHLEGIRHMFSRHNRVQPDDGDSENNDSSVWVEIWRPFGAWLHRVVESTIFDRVIMCAVLLSIVTLSIEHHNQPKGLTDILQIINLILTVVFALEMVVKLMALGWMYFRDKNNLFDFVIVIISLWETITKANRKLSVLRAFRLLRFGRLLHFLPHLRKQLLVLQRAMEEGAPLCMFMLFIVFIFSLVGMQLFGNRFEIVTLAEVHTRKHFDTLLWSMVTVFQILTGEDWNFVLYDTMAATSPWAAIYFVTVIVTGKHLLLNVLVGIVIQGFENKSLDDGFADQDPSQPASSSSGNVKPSREDLLHPEEGSAPTNTNKDNKFLNQIRKVLRWCKEREEWSFYVLSPRNRFRIFCQRVISYKKFDYTVLLFILLNCVTIAMERPGIHPESKEQLFLKVSNHVFTAVFLVEMLFKVLALGFLFGSESYCRSAWNLVDGSLVVLSFVNLFVSLASLGQNNMLLIVKVLRLIRTLRTLRLVKRTPKLKLAVEALIASIKPIGNIALICCTLIFIYAILGVQLFKGRFYTCVGEHVEHVTNKTDCLLADYHWERKFFNFDSMSQALMTLFVMYSLDEWVNIMHDGLDAVGVDKQPVINHNEWMLLFFISFMVLSFFLLDMFIGVMVDTFHECQKNQKRQNKEERNVLQCYGRDAGSPEPELTSYYTSYSPMRRRIHTLCTSRFLNFFVAVIIFINVLIMTVEHYGQPLYIRVLTEWTQYVFTIFLVIELVLKVVAFGGCRFIRNRWNQLDVAIVLVSVMSIILDKMMLVHTIPINPNILRVCRALRLAQVLKAKKIRVLLKTISKTLSQIGNICLLFVFFFFISAALGVELFGKLECFNEDACSGLNKHVNFKNFGTAWLTLFQVCTGDNWGMIMKDTMTQCGPGDHRCSSYLWWVSPVYFVAFVIMGQFVLVNLVVAVITQATEDSKEEEQVHEAK
ncbi:voltage-dependent T-type calcium channel subunit alpha-1I-like [Clinocottus analis]|uniref:voltage-dependent T-type calcium channel subunit alpha-1I-like n=1 Tax=Clinocottus analis TaxID=304258 RepID=UPI0035C13ABB